MIRHTDLGTTAIARARQLSVLIAAGSVSLGGYSRGKIYGTLQCRSGKRMKAAHRVFFKDEAAAVRAGYRPCGHCLKEKYIRWKADLLTSDDANTI